MKKIILAMLLSVLMITSVFADVIDFPWNEDFEGTWTGTPAAPAGWEQITVSGSNVWQKSSTFSHTGTYSADGPDVSGGGEQLLITPSFNFDAETSYNLKFWLKGTSTSTGSYQTNLKVNIADSYTGEGDFTQELAYYQQGIDISLDWEEKIISLDGYSGNRVIAFRLIDAWGYDIYIDDVTVEAIVEGTPATPILVTPTNGSEYVATDVNLVWTTGIDTDNAVLYLADNATFANATVVDPAPTTPSEYTTDLDIGITYYWKVVAINTTTGIEAVSSVWSFTTAAPVFPNADITFDGVRSANENMPMNPYFNYTMTQSIYYQSELDLQGSAITSVSYLYNNNSAWDETIEIFMGHTTKDVFDTTADWILEGFTNVYSGSISVNTTEPIVTIDLDVPFPYNNTDNLVVLFFATDSSCVSSSDDFYSYQVTGNRSLNKYSDSDNCYINFMNETTIPTGYLKTYLPVTGFNYQELSAEPEFSVSAETLTFATIAMNTSSNPKTITISNLGLGDLGITSIVKAGPNANQFQLIDANTYPVTLATAGSMSVQVVYAPNAAGAHTAELQITDNQGGPAHIVEIEGNSIDASIYEIDIPYAQDFETEEAFLGWTSTLDSDNSYSKSERYSSSYNAHSGTYSHRFYHSGSASYTDTELISPIVVPDMDTYRVRFWAKKANSSNNDPLVVGKYNQAMDTFTAIQTLDLTTTYAEYSAEMVVPVRANERIAFKASFSGSYQTIYVDDLTFEETPTGTLVQITPNVKDFGNVNIGYSATQTFTIANNGVIAATINAVDVPTGYATTFAGEAVVIEPETSITVDVTFTPVAERIYSGNLRVKEADGPFTSINHDVALTGTGAPVPQGASCSNPIPLTFPANYTGTTEGFIDDYSADGLNISTSYLNGDDVVYQFTLANTMILNGTITTPDSYIGAFFVQEEPNEENPVDVVLFNTASGTSLSFTNEVMAPGDYFLIISSWPSPQSIGYTIDLTTTPIPAPGAATYPTPANEAVDQSSIVNLSWNNANYTETIDLWFGEAGARDMTKVLDNVAAVEEWTTPQLATNATYNWKVVNRNYTGETVAEDIITWSFLTIGSAPEAVTYTAPANEAIDRPIVGDLTWSSATGAEGYRVYLSTDNTFIGVNPVEQPGTSYAYSGLEYSTTYYWKVLPYNVVGAPTEGVLTWSFTTIADPSIPMPVIVDFEGSTTIPATKITSTNMSVSTTHGNGSNGLYKNVYSYNPEIHVQFQSMNNVEADSELNFEYRTVEYSSYPNTARTMVAGEYIKVNVSTDGGGNYTTLTEINSTNQVVSTDFANVSVPLGAYAGQNVIVRVEAHWVSGDYYVDYDNFYFRVPPTAPIVVLSDTEIDFGVGNIFETDSEIITISNIGGGTLNISTIEIVGANAADFNGTTEAGASMALAFSETLAITVNFTPLTVGLKEATLQITDDMGRTFRVNTNSKTNNSSRSINEVALSGECVDPSISMPVIVNFDGSTSRPAEITAYNMLISSSHGNNSNGMYKNIYGTGTSQDGYAQFQVMKNVEADTELNFEYRIMKYSGYPNTAHEIVADDYIRITASNDYGATFTTLTEINSTNHIVSTDFVNVSVPLGTYAGDQIIVRLEAHRADGDYYVDFDNFYFRVPPTTAVAELSITEHDFATVILSTTSAAKTVTVTNVGVGILNINEIALTGANANDFAFEVDAEAPMALANGESLDIAVTFTPTVGGVRSATLVITDDLGNRRNANVVTLTGNGYDATISSLPYTEGFEENNVHDSQPIGWSQVSEAGTQAWVINKTNTNYERTPRTGEYNATLRYGNTDWLIRPIRVVGGQAYDVELYARQNTTTTANATIGIYYGDAATIAAMEEITGQIGLTSGDYQLVSGSFVPATSGTYYVGIKGAVTGAPWYISLDDITVKDGPTTPVIGVSATELDYGTVTVGASDTKPLTISNAGVGSLNITAIEIEGDNAADFTLVMEETLPVTLTAGLSLPIEVKFAPLANGLREATLTITDNLGRTFSLNSATRSTNNGRADNLVTLTGDGYVAPQGSVCSNPLPLVFPAEDVTGDTGDYGNDYSSGMINPSSSYLNGDDVVYQFTAATDILLNGTIVAGGSWMGVFILQDVPNLVTPAVVTHSILGSAASKEYNDVAIPAGTYYLIISTYPTPNNVTYTINLTATADFPAPANVTITTTGNGSMLNWDEVGDASSYIVYGCATPDGDYIELDRVETNEYLSYIEENEVMKFFIIEASAEPVPSNPAKGFKRRN